MLFVISITSYAVANSAAGRVARPLEYIVGHIVSHISDPPIEAAKCTRKHYGHEQTPQSHNKSMPCPAQLKFSYTAYEQVPDNKVEHAP